MRHVQIEARLRQAAEIHVYKSQRDSLKRPSRIECAADTRGEGPEMLRYGRWQRNNGSNGAQRGHSRGHRLQRLERHYAAACLQS